ncbi:putative Ubiquitin-like-conjugating enzyme ATG10 protein [Naja naja]|nr:putative Ubiquitin-like-conjugating enzyme ATG10 protein [Naja naja]
MSSILSNLHKQNKHTNYIISWLSVVGPVVGLHLPLSYANANLEETTGAD